MEARKELCYLLGCIGLNINANEAHRLDTLEAREKCQALSANRATLNVNSLEGVIDVKFLKLLRCAAMGIPQRQPVGANLP